MASRNDRGSSAEANIAAAKVKAKAALRQKHPKLTALERAFYDRFQQELAEARASLIQIKPSSKRHRRAA